MATDNPAQTIMALSTAYWASRCLHVAAELGVADALGDAPETAEALAGKLGVRPDPLKRILRCLVNHGIFALADDRFAHNAASRLLASGPRSMRSLPRMMGLPMHWAAYGELERSVRTGAPAIEAVVPEGIFARFDANPEEGRLFDEAMTGKAMGVVGPVAATYDFSGLGVIGDIGGGAGHLLSAVLDAAPAAQGVLFDLPPVVARAAERAHPRVRYVGGDFFKDPIPACDAYLLMTVLHDWSDAECVEILGAVRRAAPPGAKLLVVEAVIAPEQGGGDFAVDLDIEMLVMTTGRERTGPEWSDVFARGGFRLTRVIPTGTWCAIIEGEVA